MGPLVAVESSKGLMLEELRFGRGLTVIEAGKAAAFQALFQGPACKFPLLLDEKIR